MRGGVLCFVQIDKLYACVYILSYRFILIKRTCHKPLHRPASVSRLNDLMNQQHQSLFFLSLFGILDFNIVTAVIIQLVGRVGRGLRLINLFEFIS